LDFLIGSSALNDKSTKLFRSWAPFNKPSPVPKNVDWPSLMRLDGDELETHYRHVLESLGKAKGMLGVIFRKAQNKIQDPAKLRRLIVDLIDEGQWSSLSADVKGGAGQYFTPRRLIADYVGLAGNLRSRLKSHLRDRHKKLWDRFSVCLTIGDSHLKELESLILRTAKPSGNHQSGRFIKSENLRGKLCRDLRARQRQEINWLIGRSTSPIPKHRRQKVVQKGASILSAYVNQSTRLRATFKDKIIRARVRKNGLIRYKTKDFNSPSLAAAAVVKRNCNGWTFWKYEHGPGDWVFLNELRR
jgi:hypothetical protein